MLRTVLLLGGASLLVLLLWRLGPSEILDVLGQIILRDSPARFVMIIFIEVAAQALLVLELFWLMRALDMVTPLAFSFVIEASVKVIGIAFLFIPLQLGVSEGAYARVFDAMGLSAAAGFALAFLRRARTLAVAGVGLPTLAVLTRRRQRMPA